MKALYKSIFFSVALMFGMASCDKDELPPTGPRDNAEKLVEGTYYGTWTRATDGTDIVETGSGSISFSVDYEKYSNNVSVMTFDVTGVDIGLGDTNTAVCNISMISSGDFSFWNNGPSNTFGTTFYGSISAQGVAKMTYTKSVVEGRKTTTYIYSFEGTKQ